jgi:hypothetical protein
MALLMLVTLILSLVASGLISPPIVYDVTKELNYYPVNGKCPVREGPFEEIRLGLDFVWHGCYPEWRYIEQDALIEKLMTAKTYNREGIEPLLNGQWVVFTAGAMGAGKGYVMKYLWDKNLIPLDSFVVVDPDWIRMELPEWPYLVKMNPKLAGSVLQKESGYLAEIAREALILAKQNVLVDGSLRDTEWALKDIQKLKDRGLKIGVIHVTGNRETFKTQAEVRGHATNRYVDAKLVLSSFRGSRKTFKLLSRIPLLLDFAVQIYNSGDQADPLLTVFRIHGRDQKLNIEAIKEAMLSLFPSMPS